MSTKIKVVICLGSSCYNRGNQHILEVIKRYLKDHNLKEKIDFRGQLCSNNCTEGPVLHINDKTYKEINEEMIIRLLNDITVDLKN